MKKFSLTWNFVVIAMVICFVLGIVIQHVYPFTFTFIVDKGNRIFDSAMPSIIIEIAITLWKDHKKKKG